MITVTLQGGKVTSHMLGVPATVVAELIRHRAEERRKKGAGMTTAECIARDARHAYFRRILGDR